MKENHKTIIANKNSKSKPLVQSIHTFFYALHLYMPWYILENVIQNKLKQYKRMYSVLKVYFYCFYLLLLSYNSLSLTAINYLNIFFMDFFTFFFLKSVGSGLFLGSGGLRQCNNFFFGGGLMFVLLLNSPTYQGWLKVFS